MLNRTPILFLLSGFISLLLFFHCNHYNKQSHHLWDQKPALWDIAQQVTLSQIILHDDPQPVGMWNGGTAMNLSTKEFRMYSFFSPKRSKLYT